MHKILEDILVDHGIDAVVRVRGNNSVMIFALNLDLNGTLQALKAQFNDYYVQCVCNVITIQHRS